MYKHIYVPVDNSDFSNRAIDLAVELGVAFESKLTGIHVYAARLHDYRFKQMEYTLPEEYKDENVRESDSDKQPRPETSRSECRFFRRR